MTHIFNPNSVSWKPTWSQEKKKKRFSYNIFECRCVHISAGASRGQDKETLGPRVKGGCESPNMGAEN